MPATTTPALPPAREPGRYRVAVVCLGNICRSPMAHAVLEDRIAAAGLDARVQVVSAGTGGWHVGNPMDRRAAAVLAAHGYDGSALRAEQYDAGWLERCDLVLAMDHANLTDMAALGPAAHRDRLTLFRAFDPRAHDDDREVPDPYYGGDDGFDAVLAMVERTSDALVARLGEVVSTGSTDATADTGAAHRAAG